VLAVVGVCALLINCGSSPDPMPSFSEGSGSNGGSAGGSNTTSCGKYCDFVTTKGTGCETYNASGRCTANCQTYLNGPCAFEWGKFVQCVEASPSISCTVPENSNPVLVTSGCQAEWTTFNACLKEHDAGCPEGGP